MIIPPLLEPAVLGSRSLFETTRPEGSLKDVIIVEYGKINDQQLRGTITFSEARNTIFIEKLSLPASLLHSVRMRFNNQKPNKHVTN